MIKSLIYKTGVKILQSFWFLKGKRNLRVFNEECFFTSDTIFPSYRKLRLPKKGYASDIVRYCDFVQFHSIVSYVSQLKNAPCIIEVGAHHGAYAIVLGRIVKPMQGRVIALEPNPESFAILKENVRLNGLADTVICERHAAGDAAGYMTLELLGSQSHIASKATSSCTVDIIPLSALLAKYGAAHVDLLMIDVEGAELPVLKGFPWESAGVEKIYCELHPYAWKNFGYSSTDMRMFLNRRGYRCFDMYFREHSAFDDAAYIGPTLLCKRAV